MKENDSLPTTVTVPPYNHSRSTTTEEPGESNVCTFSSQTPGSRHDHRRKEFEIEHGRDRCPSVPNYSGQYGERSPFYNFPSLGSTLKGICHIRTSHVGVQIQVSDGVLGPPSSRVDRRVRRERQVTGKASVRFYPSRSSKGDRSRRRNILHPDRKSSKCANVDSHVSRDKMKHFVIVETPRTENHSLNTRLNGVRGTRGPNQPPTNQPNKI